MTDIIVDYDFPPKKKFYGHAFAIYEFGHNFNHLRLKNNIKHLENLTEK